MLQETAGVFFRSLLVLTSKHCKGDHIQFPLLSSMTLQGERSLQSWEPQKQRLYLYEWLSSSFRRSFCRFFPVILLFLNLTNNVVGYDDWFRCVHSRIFLWDRLLVGFVQFEFYGTTAKEKDAVLRLARCSPWIVLCFSKQNFPVKSTCRKGSDSHGQDWFRLKSFITNEKMHLPTFFLSFRFLVDYVHIQTTFQKQE